MSNLPSDQDGRCLFSETVPVTVEEDGSAKKSALLVELRANGGEYLCSGFKLTISNDKDVFLLYSLNVDAMVYSDMKENQRLLVNFESFPKKLVEMLRSCIDGRLAAHASLRGMDAQLQILERNQFRELTHLVLNLHRADEPVLRKHLAAKMVQLKSTCTVLQRQLEDANEARDRALSEAASLEGSLREAREQHERSIREMQRQSSTSEQTTKEQLVSTQQTFQCQLESLQSQLRSHDQTLLKVTAERDGLLAEVAACEQKMGANESLLGQMEAVSKKLEEKDHQLRAITALIGDGSGVYDQRMEPSAVASRFEALHSELTQSRSVCLQLKHHNRELKTKLREKCGKVTESEIILKGHKESFQNMKDELARAYRHNSKLQQDISMEVASKSQLHQRNKELETWQKSQTELVEYLNSQLLRLETASSLQDVQRENAC